MRKLIINADDLGYSEEVNSQIEECIKSGVITSSTLLANAPSFEDGVRIAKQYPQISVGVHLNLVEFAPLTNVDIFKKHGVVGDDGNFLDGAIFVVSIDDELKQAVFEEWDAQLSKIIGVGLVPSHADSHQHTHTITALRDVLCKVLDKYDIERVRCKSIPSIRLMLLGSKKVSVVLDKSNAVQTKRRNILCKLFRFFMIKFQSCLWNYKMKKRYHMTYAYYALRFFYADRSILKLGGRFSIIELMCHPGQPPFQNETEILKDINTWLPKTFSKISYAQI